MDKSKHSNEFDGLCSVTMQGGGVLVFALLGQLQAIHEQDSKLKPVAFAGASAGGLAAALAWAGCKPEDVKDKLAEIAQDPERLNRCLGVGNSSQEGAWSFDPKAVLKLRNRIELLSSADNTGPLLFRRDFFALSGLIIRYLGSIARSIRLGGAFDGGGFVDELDDILRQKLRDHFRSSPDWNDEKQRSICEKYLDRVGLPSPNSPGFDSHRPRFIDFDLVRNTFKAEVDAPALVLTATDVEDKSVLLIDSQRAAFEHLPISDAIRATIGFPLAFQPKTLSIVRDARRGGRLATRQSAIRDRDSENEQVYISKERFVDGGVLANSPSWALAEYLRQTMHGHTTSPPGSEGGIELVRLADSVSDPFFREVFTKNGEELESFDCFPSVDMSRRADFDFESGVNCPLRPFAFRPMIHLNLTFSPSKDSQPHEAPFLRNLFDLITTGARTWFERRALRSGDRYFQTNQPASKLEWRHSILDFHKLDAGDGKESSIDKMFTSALDHARSRLQANLRFGLPDPHASRVITRTAEEVTSIDLLLDEAGQVLDKWSRSIFKLDPKMLSGATRLLLIRGATVSEYHCRSFGLGSEDIPPHDPVTLDTDAAEDPEQCAFFSRRAVISRDHSSTHNLSHVFKVLLPVFDTAVQLEVLPAITLRPFRRAFDGGMFTLSEKRDSVLFGFLCCELFISGAGDLRQYSDEFWAEQILEDRRPPSSLFELAEVADRMSAQLTMSFPSAPDLRRSDHDAPDAARVERKLAYTLRERAALLRSLNRN